MAALKRLEREFEVSFGLGVFERVHMDGPKLETRLTDIQQALNDPRVDIVMSAIGGYSCAELLPYIDVDRIRQSQKIFCGYSDVSVLLNFITLKTGICTLHGPHFSSFGHPSCADDIQRSFLRALHAAVPFELAPMSHWGDETWYNNKDWHLQINSGPRTLREGGASGTALGGNVVSLVGNLPSGTWPDQVILFAEMHAGYSLLDFIRWLGAILRTLPPGGVAGILIGKMPFDVPISESEATQLIDAVSPYCTGPIVADLDFGHNVPFFSFPIGARIYVDAFGERANIRVSV